MSPLRITQLYNVHTARRVSAYRVARVVNFINVGGGDPLCTLHGAEGLYAVYGWVRCRCNMRDPLHKS